jgi:hypothetical protein
MNAKVEYRSGLMLILSKYGNAPLLLLEWVAENPNKGIIRKVINDTEGNLFKVRFNGIREDYYNAAEYINNNS